jgi:DNA polymerase-3 subunit alpha
MSIDWIKENNLGKNIIALSACQAGRVSRLLMNDKEQEAKEFVEKLQSTFAYVALEIQSHSTDSQIEANKKIYPFVVKNNYPYVFTTDAHMVSKDQQDTHSIFVQISEDREVGESYTDCFLQNENDIKEILGAQFGEEVLIKGMEETIKISDMIEDIDIGLNKGSVMPVVKIQEGFKNNEEYLRHLVYKDFDIKFKNMSEEDRQIRRDRIETELPILYKSNFTDYFIMLYMLVQESNNRGIPRGYSRGCFIPNTSILLSNGQTKKIQDIIVGDEVISHKGNYKKVNKIFEYDCKEEMIKIKGNDSDEITCTNNHEFFAVKSSHCYKYKNNGKTRVWCSPTCESYKHCNESFEFNPEWIEAKDLKVGDYLCYPKIKENTKKDNIILDLKDFDKDLFFDEKFVWYRNALNTYNCRPIKRFIEIDEDFCELCGWYISQGWNKFDETGKHNYAIGFAHHSNKKDLIEKNAKILEMKFGIVPNIKKHASKQVVQINLYSKVLSIVFEKMFGKYAQNKHVPNFMMELDPSLLKKLMKGLFDGDGSYGVEFDAKIKYSTVSYNLAKQVQMILSMLGYASSINRRVHKKENWFDEFSVQLSGLSQLIRFNDVVENQINIEKSNFHSSTQTWADENYIYKKIESINLVEYNGKVYDISVDDDTSYIVGSYAVHNSGANCLCLYMLGVTQIDSIRWDLDFSRFANLGRKSLADFDWDISKLRRKEFVEISEELFGKENVAPICTFNTLSTKVAIRDIGKVLNDKGIYSLSYPLRDETAKMIPTIEIINESGEKQEKEIKLKEALLQNSKLAKIAEEYPLWIKYVVELEGLPKSMGRHAAGTLITPTPIIDYCPICQDSEGNVMTQIEMHSAMDDLGLIKMDYLGLETVDIVDNTLKLAGLSWNDVDINNIDLDDKKVYNEVYKTGNTTAVFQMESFEGKSMCVDAETDNIEDVIAINAFNRPGTKDGFPTYCFNKKNPDKVEVLHPDLKEIFNKTQFVLLYQEQALQIFRYAGFLEEDVDNARRAIGKKQKDVMDKLHDKLCDGLITKGWNDDQIETMWELLLKQSEYSFNRGHACSYALLSYLTAYLKTYYPCEFFASCLSAKSDNLPKLSVLINECQRLNIKILPPNINKSGKEFTPFKEKNSILFGLLGIKGIGDTLVEKIIEEKNAKPFENINDFISRTGASISQVVCLIKAGAIPTKNKKDFMLKYASSLFNDKEYSPVNSIPSAKILLEKWGLDVNRIEKDKRLVEYNKLREKDYNHTQKEKFNKHIKHFEEKYLQDEDLWEYQTLSMFLSNNPFAESQEYIKNIEEVESGQKGVVIGVISEITKKNDKHGKQFAYIKIFSTYNVIEIIVWHTQYNTFQELIKKGQKIAILVKKTDDNRLVAESFKTYDKWLEDRKLKK